MRIKEIEIKKKIIIIGALAFNVIFAIPFLLLSLNKKNFFLLAFCLGILGYFFIPPIEYDLYRHFEFYDSYKYSYDNFFSQKDFFLTLITIIGKKIGCKRNFISFISAFLYYFFILKIFLKQIERNNIIRVKKIIYLLVYLLIFPLTYYTAIRFPVGLALYSYGLYLIYFEKKRKGYIYIIFSILTHFSFLIPTFLLFINIFFFNKIKNINLIKILVILSVIISLNKNIMIDILFFSINQINNLLGRTIFNSDSYLFGKWGINRTIDLNIIGIIVYQMKILIQKFIYLLETLTKKKIEAIDSYIYLLTIYCFITSISDTSFVRYGNILIFLILMRNTNNDFLKKRMNRTNIILGTIIIFILYNLFFEIKTNIYYFYDSYKNIFSISGLNFILNLFI